MSGPGKNSVLRQEVGDEAEGQRVDNYLCKILKGVPKSHVYRILRSGEVRVNSGRVGPDYRLKCGDQVRIPPVRTATRAPRATPVPDERLEAAIVFEDEHLIALDKPAGLAVHGGSGVSFGIIEQLRAQRPHAKTLELVHRLDRETSGVLLLAKKRSALTALHSQLRDGKVKKFYLALVKGQWRNEKQHVRLNLHKYVLASGERRVSVNADGQAAHTIFQRVDARGDYTLLQAELKTGRTHQIRVHLAHLGFPIAGDDKYGDFALNKALARAGLRRMFLHASRISFEHPAQQRMMTVEAPLPADLAEFMRTLA